jgi:hypothetical protein
LGRVLTRGEKKSPRKNFPNPLEPIICPVQAICNELKKMIGKRKQQQQRKKIRRKKKRGGIEEEGWY